jgi:hypothetical protein
MCFRYHDICCRSELRASSAGPARASICASCASMQPTGACTSTRTGARMTADAGGAGCAKSLSLHYIPVVSQTNRWLSARRYRSQTARHLDMPVVHVSHARLSLRKENGTVDCPQSVGFSVGAKLGTSSLTPARFPVVGQCT